MGGGSTATIERGKNEEEGDEEVEEEEKKEEEEEEKGEKEKEKEKEDGRLNSENHLQRFRNQYMNINMYI